MWVLRLTSFEYCLFMHTILSQQLFQFCGHGSCDLVYWYLVLASQVHEIIILHLFTFQNWNMQHWNMKSRKCFSFSNYAVLEIFLIMAVMADVKNEFSEKINSAKGMQMQIWKCTDILNVYWKFTSTSH